jgi:hypothetical protein
MHTIRLTTAAAGILLLPAIPMSAQNKTANSPVMLKTVKYAGLADAVAQQRGKVVVVDLWGFF